MKLCSECKISKPLDFFSKDVSKFDGLRSGCKQCRVIYSQKYRSINLDIIKLKNKIYYHSNKSKRNEYIKQWRLDNPVYGSMYRQKNKEKLKKKASNYQKSNKGKIYAINANYRASKYQQTPKWACLKQIERFYNNCPVGHHVDHIIPLRGKEVCGLHVIENLQYLLAYENIKKGNRLWA